MLSSIPQRVHVGIWYILRAQRGSHIPTLRPKYTPYSYMDPLGPFFVIKSSSKYPRTDVYGGPIRSHVHSVCLHSLMLRGSGKENGN